MCNLPKKCGIFFASCALKHNSQQIPKKKDSLDDLDIQDAFELIKLQSTRLEQVIRKNVSKAFIGRMGKTRRNNSHSVVPAINLSSLYSSNSQSELPSSIRKMNQKSQAFSVE